MVCWPWEMRTPRLISGAVNPIPKKLKPGDLFASIIAADAVNGVPFAASVRKASKFIKACIVESEKREIPVTDGVCFEDLLYKLR